MNLIEKFFEPDTNQRPGIKMGLVTTITIHWIGPYPKQTIYDPYNWWLKEALDASAHYIVKDDDVLYCIPVQEVAWHCGSKGNYSSIGIEVVPQSEKGEFGDKTIATLKELLGTLPKLPLLRHYDWTKKDCPLYYTPLVIDGDKHWLELKEKLCA